MGGKTKLIMRADLRLDLKDSGALWSDAELDRSVERAVSDLSRFLPKEKTYEESLQFTVADESVTMPKDTDPDYILDNQTLNGKVAGDTFTLTGTQPDHPRVMTLLLTDADSSITNFTIIVKGTDRNDKAIEESFHFGSGLSQTGIKEFKSVREVELNQVAGVPAAGDVLDIGIGAYTTCWAELANKPIKWGSETSVTDVDDNALARNTDFYLDYTLGRIKAISGGGIIKEDTVTISYTKSQLEIDLSSLPDLIRVERTEYPVGDVPQSFVPFDIWGNILGVVGGPEGENQGYMAEDKHIRIHYAAEHQPPTDYSPGSYPEFLENTLVMAAGAYALLIYALKQEHQVVTDLASVRTNLAAATTAQTALGTALTNLKKYLDNNSNADAAGLLAQITTDIAGLRTAIVAAADVANTYLDSVATDITAADAVRANYMGATANYVDGGAAPDVKKYLDDGDALLNTVAVGGEGQQVPTAYREYAQATRDGLVTPHEQDRQFHLDDATRRTNAALGYTQEAAQRLSNLRSYIEQSQGYAALSSLFAREAETRLGIVNSYISEAAGYAEASGAEMMLADRFRTEAIERRNEVYGIWKDRKQYIGDYTMSSVRQMPGG